MAGIFDLTRGRKKHCKNTIGGVKALYIASYKKVNRSEILYDGVEISEFPKTFIYKFEAKKGSIFSQTQKDSDGGKSFIQKISISFNGISAFDNSLFKKMLLQDYFIVVEDYLKNFFLAGFRNGLACEKIDLSTNDIYNISFSGEEIEFAPFCSGIIGSDLIVVDFFDYYFENKTDNFFLEDKTKNFIF
jgi:hypothetical protein